jgi:hypothetical protein
MIRDANIRSIFPVLRTELKTYGVGLLVDLALCGAKKLGNGQRRGDMKKVNRLTENPSCEE